MTIEKAELKIELSRQMAEGFEDARLAEERNVYRWEGAKTLGDNALKSVMSVLQRLTDDTKAEIVTAEQEALLRPWLMRCYHAVDNLKVRAEASKLEAIGKEKGLRKSVETANAICAAEERKLAGLKESPEEGAARAVGAHPGSSEAQKRKAAAQDEADGSTLQTSAKKKKTAKRRPRKKK